MRADGLVKSPSSHHSISGGVVDGSLPGGYQVVPPFASKRPSKRREVKLRSSMLTMVMLIGLSRLPAQLLAMYIEFVDF